MRRLEKGKAVRSDAKAQREAARDKQDGKKKIKVVFEDQEQETPEPATAEE